MRDSINQERRRFISSAAAALGAARLGVIGSAVQQMACAALTERSEGALPSLSGATEWLNSPPLTPAGLRGKIDGVEQPIQLAHGALPRFRLAGSGD